MATLIEHRCFVNVDMLQSGKPAPLAIPIAEHRAAHPAHPARSCIGGGAVCRAESAASDRATAVRAAWPCCRSPRIVVSDSLMSRENKR